MLERQMSIFNDRHLCVICRLERLVMAVVVFTLALTATALARPRPPILRPRHQKITTQVSSPRRPADPAARAAILGGSSAETGTYPWLAYIWRKSGEETYACTGTVVSPNLVLTAGHCAEQIATGQLDEPSEYVVVTGNVDWASSPRQISGVARVVVYPGFDRASLIGDAALLVLSTPTTQPALALATYPSDVDMLAGGTSAIVAGWGEAKKEAKDTTTRLQWAPTVVQLPGYCESSQFASPFYERYEICATYPPKFETGVCFGDSGGPLIVQSSSGEDVELGLVSRGYGECSTQYPTVFTRADLIAPWVQEWIQAVKPSTQSTPTPAIGPIPSDRAPSSPTVAPAKAPNGALLDGVYLGGADQPSESIGMVIEGGRLTGLASTVVYRCRSDKTITKPLDGLSRNESEPLDANHDFEVKFSSGSQSDIVTGAVDPSRGSISGTLQGSLTAHGGSCSTGSISWRAHRAKAYVSKARGVGAGSYYGQTNGGGQIAIRVARDGRRLEQVEFSAEYQCPRHHRLRMAKSFDLRPGTGRIARFGTFTIRLEGNGYSGRVDGTFGLGKNGLVFGTLNARALTRFGSCQTGLVPWAS